MYCLFWVVLCIVCVYMCTVLLLSGGYPIAVKYIIYHIMSYHIRSYHHIVSYHISYHIIIYHTISYIIYYIIYHIISYHIIYIIILFYSVLFYSILFYSLRQRCAWIFISRISQIFIWKYTDISEERDATSCRNVGKTWPVVAAWCPTPGTYLHSWPQHNTCTFRLLETDSL
jgi:hypothetical protein